MDSKLLIKHRFLWKPKTDKTKKGRKSQPPLDFSSLPRIPFSFLSKCLLCIFRRDYPDFSSVPCVEVEGGRTVPPGGRYVKLLPGEKT